MRRTALGLVHDAGEVARIIAGDVIDRVAKRLANFEFEIVALTIEVVFEIADRARAAAINLLLVDAAGKFRIVHDVLPRPGT